VYPVWLWVNVRKPDHQEEWVKALVASNIDWGMRRGPGGYDRDRCEGDTVLHELVHSWLFEVIYALMAAGMPLDYSTVNNRGEDFVTTARRVRRGKFGYSTYDATLAACELWREHQVQVTADALASTSMCNLWDRDALSRRV